MRLQVHVSYYKGSKFLWFDNIMISTHYIGTKDKYGFTHVIAHVFDIAYRNI